MIITVDDLCLSYLDNFAYFDEIKRKYSEFKMIVFAIANNKNEELLVESDIFKTWFDQHKDWVEVAVHSNDHKYPPDGDRDDEEFWIRKALRGLLPFLPVDYGYRSPGWQTTNKTVGILKKLNFKYIAYETMIKDLKEWKIIEKFVLNSHLYDVDSIKGLGVKINEILRN